MGWLISFYIGMEVVMEMRIVNYSSVAGAQDLDH